jgi:hypothetical protein
VALYLVKGQRPAHSHWLCNKNDTGRSACATCDTGRSAFFSTTEKLCDCGLAVARDPAQ